MRVLCTGGAGYIGSVLVEHLLRHGYAVTVLDSFRHGENSLAHLCWDPALETIRGDIRDLATRRIALTKADIVIPLAAIVGAKACESDQLAALSTNYEAVRGLCKDLGGDQRIVIPTTNSGYGIGGEAECDEDSPLRPLTLYGRTKVQAEGVVLDRCGISLRLATVFGASPRMRMDLLVNDFVYRAVRDRAVVLFEAGFRRNYVHVRDVANAFHHAIRNYETMRGRPYNVGDTRANMTKLALCKAIAYHVPGFVWHQSMIGSDPDKRDYVVSNRRFEASGWHPEFTLDDGIRELIKLYRGLRPERYANS